MTLKYYKELDGVRGIAALMIVFFHFMKGGFFNDSEHYIWLHKISKFGQTGVTLFFVLSGFLITRILLKAKDGEGYFSTFYIRRSLRIFPLYYLFLVLTYFVIPLIINEPIESFKYTWTYWLYLQNFAITFNWKNIGQNHLWSLAVEEHFYLFWPVLIYYCSVKRLVQMIGVITLLSLLCRIYLIHIGHGTFYFTFTTFDCLAIGALLAVNEIRQWFSVRLLQIGAGVLFVLLVLMWVIFGSKESLVVQYFKLPITALFYLCCIGILILRETFLNKLFKSKFLTFTGKISYGLYIFHPVCFYYLYKYNLRFNLIPALVVYFAVSYLIATISFYGFENKFIKLKKRFESKKPVELASN